MNKKINLSLAYRVALVILFTALVIATTFARFYTPPSKTDPFNTLSLKNFSVFNILDFEPPQPDAASFRWAFGPSAGVHFDLNQDKTIKVKLTFSSPIPNQHMKIMANGHLLLELDLPTPHKFPDERQTVEATFTGNKGTNEFILYFSRWSGNGFVLNNKDRRPFAINIWGLTFTNGDDAK